MDTMHELDARRINCETRFAAHGFGSELMIDWSREASALYQSVGAEFGPGTTFCRIRDDALKALAA